MKVDKRFNKTAVVLAVGVIVIGIVAAVGFSRPTRARLTALFTPPAGPPAPLSATATGERKILYYEDPMHPWYRSDKPGIAPDGGQ